MSCGVIFLHGSGDTGDGFQSWIADVNPSFLPDLSSIPCAFRFPSAIPMMYSYSGCVMHVWHDRNELALSCVEDTAGIMRSIGIIDEEIESLMAQGVALERICIIGLSMGGHMALHMSALSQYSENIACIVALSCFLSTESPLYQTIASRQANGTRIPPIRMMHGDSDRMIPLQWGRTTADLLENLNVNITFSSINSLGHELSPDELAQAYAFLVQHIGN